MEIQISLLKYILRILRAFAGRAALMGDTDGSVEDQREVRAGWAHNVAHKAFKGFR